MPFIPQSLSPQFHLPDSICLSQNQSILVVIQSYNASSVTTHPVHFIDPASIGESGVYNVTVMGLCKEMKYIADLSLRNSSGIEINQTQINFSKCFGHSQKRHHLKRCLVYFL